MWDSSWLPSADFWIPETVALSAVALIGYMFGRSSLKSKIATMTATGPKELQRAARIARQLEDTIDEVRRSLALHQTHVAKFKKSVGDASLLGSEDVMPLLSLEAENVLVPTLRLATQLSQAYDQLRKHSKSLANFTDGRTDPMTGLGNSLALEEQLELQLADRTGGTYTASLVLISASCDAGSSAPSEPGRELTKTIAGHIEHCIRENDYVARIGGNDFAVLLSNTSLAGARVFGTRLRSRLELQMGILANCGVAEALSGDTPATLLSRADSALYSARADRPGAQYVHSGHVIQADRPLVASSVKESSHPELSECECEPPL